MEKKLILEKRKNNSKLQSIYEDVITGKSEKYNSWLSYAHSSTRQKLKIALLSYRSAPLVVVKVYMLKIFH